MVGCATMEMEFTMIKI